MQQLDKSPLNGHIRTLLLTAATYKATFNSRGQWRASDGGSPSAIFSCLPLARRAVINEALDHFDKVRLYVVDDPSDNGHHIEYLVGVKVHNGEGNPREVLHDLIGNLESPDRYLVDAASKAAENLAPAKDSSDPLVIGLIAVVAIIGFGYLLTQTTDHVNFVLECAGLLIGLLVAYWGFLGYKLRRRRKAAKIQLSLQNATPATAPA